ncbi:MAG: phage/plasmid primase, P4 family [Syntrophobacteraceae bacterium]
MGTSELLSALNNVQQRGDSYQAQCPAHEDVKASLSIGTGKDGRILLHCHAGCTPESILAAVGLKWDVVFPDSPPAKKAKPTIQAVYDYTDAGGQLLFQTVRFFPKDFRQRQPDGKGGWVWNLKGITQTLYRLPEVLKAQTVFIAEGEKDADNLAGLGLTATTSAMGAGKWKAHYNQSLRGKKVAIVPDNDEPGRKHAQSIAAGLLGVAEAVKILDLPDLKAKGDVSDWIDNGGSKDALLALLQQTPLFTGTCRAEQGNQEKPQPIFPFTDFGNAERFAAQNAEKTRYCHTWGKWLIWTGTHWQIDETTLIFQLAKETVRKMYAAAGEIEDDDRRKALSKHARASESSGRVQAMLSLAQTEQCIATTGARLDSNPWLLNVQNGTLDLRTGNLREHRRQDLLTKIAPVTYDPKAESPTQWMSFLNRIMAGSPGLISYLQKLVGYSLTGDTREKCLPVLHGIGDNGKTILTATIGGLLGDYAQETPVETLMIKKQESIPNDIARLKGARLVTASEGERGQRLAESLIKRLTGGDKISARFLHQEWFDFTPEFKIWLSTNYKPIIRGSDNAIWNRIHLIPFEVIIPKAEQIPRTVMLERLRQEWPGILKWAVEGCLLWQKEGLQKPEEVLRATEDYRADSDIIGGFVSDCCILNPLAKCKTSDLFAEYEKWCSGSKEEPITVRNFNATLQERGFKKTRLGHKGDKAYQGIGLRTKDENADRLTDADRILGVFPIEKIISEKKVKNGSASVSRSASVICSDCADFRPNAENHNDSGHCLGNPPDGERFKFPNVPIDCPEFRPTGKGATCE